ncbi:PRC-barrel domain-containing protein [Pedosphaera parvula]|uniref:PRC-barrel domain protein n=1 Tax=Pedosphaera parvula (strain Ellin514) TaxID=320771 RepID=B9XB55_PEDPL|nr:PRC-barrel domain-containing protein [Pedosphaera parvula]EEF62740.1 PRC-barrel domain protein [Pedosphaera parvula Ellin514]
MKSKALILGGAAAVFCLGVPGQSSGNTNGKSSSEAPEAIIPGQPAPGSPKADQSEKESPASIDRASHLIGMKVKNQKNENLGTIRDVVFNVDNARVAYIVLEKADHDQKQDANVAVPMMAFTPSADKNSLTLNVDKERFQNAHGFAMENLPSVSNPIYGAEPQMPEHIIIVPVPVSPQHPNQGQDEERDTNPESGHGLKPDANHPQRYL